jgi:hypothetical protein
VTNSNGFWIRWLHWHPLSQFLLFTISYSAIANLPTSQITRTRYIRFLTTGLLQELSLQITVKSSCHFLFNHLALPTLQNSTQFSNANSLIPWESRSRSRSLLPATSPHPHTWHRAPLGPIAIYLFSVKTFGYFPFRWSSLFIKERLAFVYIYRLVFTYFTLLHLRLLFSPPSFFPFVDPPYW